METLDEYIKRNRIRRKSPSCPVTTVLNEIQAAESNPKRAELTLTNALALLVNVKEPNKRHLRVYIEDKMDEVRRR